MRAFVRLMAASIVVAGSASALRAKPCPPPPRPVAKPIVAKPIVVGLSGWNPPIIAHNGSAVRDIVDRLRGQGWDAEVYEPTDWSKAADKLVARGDAEGPIVLIGYSMGAAAAIHVASKLGSVGIPVRRIVVVEAYSPEPVPANVGDVIHYHATRLADRVAPGPGHTAAIRNLDLNGLVPGIEGASHVSVSLLAAVQDIVVGDIEAAVAPERAAEAKRSASSRAKARSAKSDARCRETDPAPAAPGR